MSGCAKTKDTLSACPAPPDKLKAQCGTPGPGIQQESNSFFKKSGGICPRDKDARRHEPAVCVR